MRILIVDANSNDLILVREELEGVSGEALELVPTGSLGEAAERARAEPFDVALLDLGLPDGTGLETLARFGQLAPELPVVIFTGKDEEGRALEALSLGAQDCVVKGEISGRRLLRVLRFAVKRRKLLCGVTQALARLRGILESAPGSFLVVQASDFTIVDASGAYLKATRTRRDEIVGRGLFEVFPDDPSEPRADGSRNLRHSLEWVIRYGEPHTMPAQRYPIPIPEEEGGGFEERWWSPVNAPVFDAEGSVRFVVHRVVDVTEYVQMRLRAGAGEDEPLLQEAQEKMEADLFLRAREVEALNRKLEESRLLLDMAGEVARIGGWAVDVGGDRVDLSDQVCDIHGLPHGSRPSVAEALDFYHPEDRPLVAEHFGRLVEGGEPYDLEVRFIPRGGPRAGKTIWVRAIGIPVRDSSGEVVRVQGAFQDLTPAKEAEATVERETRRFRELAEAMPQIVWTAGPDGMVDYFSSDMSVYTGLPAHEMRGEGWGQVIHLDDLPLAVDRWLRSVETGTRYRVDCRIRRHDGVYRWHLVQADCARDEAGAIVRWYGSAIDVDDRRRIEEKVTQLGERMTTTLESITDAFFTLDREWRFTFLNGTAEQVLDRSPGELLGKSIWDEYPAAAGSLFETKYRQAAAEGASVHFEAYYPAPLDAWYDVRAYPSDEGLAVYFQDVTERRAAEHKLMESEERFRQIAEHIEDVFWITTPDKALLEYVSPAFAQIWGRSPEDLYKRPESWMEAIVPEDRERAAQAVRRQTEIPYEQEYRILRPDGEERWILDRSFPVRGEEGGIERIIGVARDVTKAKHLEERFGALIQEITDVICVISPEGVVRMSSPSVLGIIGYTQAEFEGTNALEVVHPKDRPAVLEALRQVTEEVGSTARVEFRVITRGGQPRHVEAVARNLLGNPAVEGVLVTIRDITERTELEGRVRQMQKMDSIGQLAGGIAHDFNNILTVIRSQTDLVLMDVPPGIDAEDLKIVQAAADRAATLTGQLLAFSREQVLQPRIVRLAGTVRDAGRLIERLIGEDVRVVYDLDEAVPLVRVDPHLLEQVALNLALNARDAMPSGGTLTLSTGVEQVTPEATESLPGVEPGSYATLSVSDTGTGMSKEVQQRIFEPFFTTKPKGKGTGLGLAMVYGTVKQSGGSIHLESEPGRGSTFTLRFPPVETGEGEAPPVPAERPAWTATDYSVTGTVLVVEDDPAVRRVATKVLERAGFQVLTAEDAERGLEVLEGGEPVDAVLSDLVLPGMSGFDFFDGLRDTHPDVALVIMSGYAEGSTETREGFPEDVAFLPKPFTPEELVDVVRNVLSGG